MSTPTDGPLVPPSGQAPQPVPAPVDPYAPPAWPQQQAWPQQPAWSPQPEWSQQPGIPPQGWGTPDSRALQEAETALRKARTALGWAIAAAVGALAALVAAFVVPALFAFGSSVGGTYSYRGQVEPFEAGSALNGSAVSDAVEAALVDDGADVSSIDCPDTETAQISTVIACQGSVDGSDWTYLVHVLDRQGSILITEY